MKPLTPLPPLNAKRWDLLQKLLRLALDNNQEHESAAAALQVCRLLRELQIVERLERLPSPPTVPPPPVDPYERFARKWWGSQTASPREGDAEIWKRYNEILNNARRRTADEPSTDK